MVRKKNCKNLNNKNIKIIQFFLKNTHLFCGINDHRECVCFLDQVQNSNFCKCLRRLSELSTGRKHSQHSWNYANKVIIKIISDTPRLSDNGLFTICASTQTINKNNIIQKLSISKLTDLFFPNIF